MDDWERLLSSSLKEVGDANMRWHPSFEARARTAVREIHRKRLMRAVTVAAASWLLVTGAFAAMRMGVDRSPTVPPGAARDSGLTTTTIRAVGFPEALDSSSTAIWVLSGTELLRIDPATNEAETSVLGVPASVHDLAVEGSTLWTAGWTGDMGPGGGSPVQGAVQRIAVSEIPLHDSVPFQRVGSVERFAGREALDSVAVGAGGVWVTNRLDDELWRLEPTTGRVEAKIPVDASPVDVAATTDAVWVTHTATDPNHHGAGGASLVRVDSQTNQVVAGPVPAGECPHSVAARPAGVWVLDYCADVVRRFDPQTLQLESSVSTGREPADLAVGGGFVWVLSSGDGIVERIDMRTDEIVGEAVTVGKSFFAGLTYGAGSAWAPASFSRGSTVDDDDIGILRMDANSR